MEKIIHLFRKIAPEFISVAEDRYNILRQIQHAEPIGRRALAAKLQMGERVVRAQVDFLKEAGLIEFTQLGMKITPDGLAVINLLSEYIHSIRGLTVLETELSAKLGVSTVVIVPGDIDGDQTVLRELGRAAASMLAKCLREDMILAVSGGSTIAKVAEAVSFCAPKTVVVPARGGLGEKVEYQANTIAAIMAEKLGGKYRLLHIPDGMSDEALEVILSIDARTAAVADMIKHADVLVHGIGRASDMALRRGLDGRIVSDILGKGAVGEALGYYFDVEGKCVHTTGGIGLKLGDLRNIGMVIAVAGGRQKAEAIIAVTNARRQDILVIDEAAAMEIRSILAGKGQ